MNIYWIGHKLYFSWFVVTNLLGIFIYTQTNLYFTILSQLVIIPGVYALAQISAKRYQYFFNNCGFSQGRIFFMIAICHLAVSLILTDLIMRIL